MAVEMNVKERLLDAVLVFARDVMNQSVIVKRTNAFVIRDVVLQRLALALVSYSNTCSLKH